MLSKNWVITTLPEKWWTFLNLKLWVIDMLLYTVYVYLSKIWKFCTLYERFVSRDFSKEPIITFWKTIDLLSSYSFHSPFSVCISSLFFLYSLFFYSLFPLHFFPFPAITVIYLSFLFFSFSLSLYSLQISIQSGCMMLHNMEMSLHFIEMHSIASLLKQNASCMLTA